MTKIMKTEYIELSKMTKKIRKQYLIHYENMFINDTTLGFKLQKPTSYFNDFGLKYSSDFLNKVGILVVMFPIEIMQNYVDIIVKNIVDNDPEKLKEFLPSEEKVNLYEINATSIGNLAYIILNANNKKIKNRCKVLLDRIYKDTLELILNFKNSKSES